MRLTEHIHLVGSGLLGMNQTDEFDCNVYVLNAGHEYVMFDSGAGRNPETILRELEKDGLAPERIAYIVATHAHADHSGGIEYMRQRTGATVLGSAETVRILTQRDEEAIQLSQAKETGMYPESYIWTGCKQMEVLRHRETVSVGAFTLEWISTPGHSGDSISCYVPELKAMFCGDVVFGGGRIAALSSVDFSIQQLAESVALLGLYSVDRLLPGHLCPVLRNGGEPIRTALQTFERLGVPSSIV